MHQFKQAQLRYVLIIALTWLAVFFITRSALLVSHWVQATLRAAGLLSLLLLRTRLYSPQPCAQVNALGLR
jgi:inner membrane protein involved in colicin E2 resistance